MEQRERNIEVQEKGLKVAVLGLCKRWGNQLVHKIELNNIFMRPKCANYDQLVDELAEQYWNGYLDEDAREEYKNGRSRVAKRSSEEGTDIEILTKFKRANYPYICAHIQGARKAGIKTDIPYSSCVKLGPDTYIDSVVVPILKS